MKLQCVLCGREYEPGSVRYTCPSCGLDGTLDVLYDYDEIRTRLNRKSLASCRERQGLSVIATDRAPKNTVHGSRLFAGLLTARFPALKPPAS